MARPSVLPSFNPFITCLLFLFFITLPTSTNAYSTITYTETIKNLTMIDVYTGWDNTAIIQFAAPLNNTCFLPKILLRILYSNGSIIPVDIDNLNIPDYNFCTNNSTNLPVQVNAFGSGYIWISWFVANNGTNSSAAYDVYAALLDASGKAIQSNVPLGPAFACPNLLRHPGFTESMDKENGGFLYTMYNNNSLVWVVYDHPDENGQITPIKNGVLTTVSTSALAFSTVGGYGLAMVVSSSSDPQVSSMVKNRWSIKVQFLDEDAMSFADPLIIYETVADLYAFKIGPCNIAANGNGYQCVLRGFNGIDKVTNQQIWQKVDFLSNGATANIQYIGNVTVNTTISNTGIDLWSLPFGGTLVASIDYKNSVADNVTGQIFDSNEQYTGQWDIPHNVQIWDPISYSFPVGVFHNNTVWFPSNVTVDSWSVTSTALPKFLDNDRGYNNIVVNSTKPPIDFDALPCATTNIKITYALPIDLSTQNISIYQSTDQGDLLRQTLNGQSSWITKTNSQTLSIKVLTSTFNQPGGDYYVVVDNGFVKGERYGEKLLGIERGVWHFTLDNVTDSYSESTTALLRLTDQGSRYFESLATTVERADFFSNLKSQVVQWLPINSDRLSASNKYQYDDNGQILIAFDISSTRDPNQRSSAQVINDLDTMVTNKYITPLANNQHLSLLDETYGFKPTLNLWDQYKWELLGAGIAFLLLSILYFVIDRRYPKGNSTAIFKLTIIIFDFGLRLAFIINNAHDVPWLFIPSVAVFAFSIIVNFGIALTINLYENFHNPAFHQWVSNCASIASIFTLLSAADITALGLVGSELGGYVCFSAPFSSKGQDSIFFGKILNILTQNLAQFIIQILYRQNVVQYNMISLLVLVTSSLVLINSLLTIIYEVVVRYKRKKQTVDTETAYKRSSVKSDLTSHYTAHAL